ncbi:MAG: DNA/RNA non-specific endonuclease [Alloprevotella sp.]|nr:DNA/RNA non-specific endonuclease [Alloprevotella sp.]
MTYSIKNFFMVSALTLSLTACSADGDYAVNDAPETVTFTATTQRATATAWTAGDQIGVYMMPTGQTLDQSEQTTPQGTCYVTIEGNGYFAGQTTALAYPKDGSAVDFVAYYPYSANVANGIYAVDLHDQSNPEAIDLMYADNAKGLNRQNAPVGLNFTHQLAKVQLNIVNTAGSSLEGLSVSLDETPTTANFHLADATFSDLGGNAGVTMTVSVSGQNATATAFVIPNAGQSATQPLKVTFTTTEGKTKQVTIADNVTYEKGQVKAYTVRLTQSGGTQTEEVKYAKWTETPVITANELAAQNLKYITHYFTDGSKQVRNYSMLYDTDLKIAYWVAYPLCNYYTQSNVSRTDEWAFDPAIDASLQANMTKGINGYDRGHQIPSADRLVNLEANRQTFYFTNMTPQVGSLNQNIWATLEGKLRNWSSNIDTLYVVTGAMPSAVGSTSVRYTTDNDGVNVAVPAYYFKALARIDRQTGTAYTIAFKFNNASYKGSSYMDAALTVKELESQTGFTFFPTISDTYKTSYDASKWQ